jgi:hypothetical protein
MTPQQIAIVKPLAERWLRRFVDRLPAELGQAAGKQNAALGAIVQVLLTEALAVAAPYALELFDTAADGLALWMVDAQKAVNGDDYPFYADTTAIIVEQE